MPKRSLRFGMCRHVIEGARLFSHIYYSAKIARKVPRQDAIILPIPRFWPAIALDLGAQPEKQWSERTTEDASDTASALHNTDNAIVGPNSGVMSYSSHS